MMNPMTNDQLTDAINQCWDAVEASQAGPIYLSEVRPDGSRMTNTLAAQAFLTLLGRLVPNVQAPATYTARQEEPRESWQVPPEGD